MTRRVGPSEQGQLQGANQSLVGVASVVGPLLYGLSFAWAVRHPEWNVPGLPFLLASLTMAVCLTIAVWSGHAARAHAIREAAR
jgi:DHA1 family tetracycline resistance protein-like MFS transporter